MNTPVVVFSHLRWSSMLRRPHHVMKKLAASRDVLFVEEPVTNGAVAGLDIQPVAQGIRVVQPQLPMGGPGFGDRQQNILKSHLERFLEREGWDEIAAWLYTPMALPLARALHPRTIIYDCMQEWSRSPNAAGRMIDLEHELFECADVVFTSGSSLCREKERFHPHVHWVPSSVDREHFAQANSVHDTHEQARLPRPRLGFFGVIDQRLDLDLIRYLATERPKWQIVLVGPVAVERSSLPWGPNLRYMGQQPYRDLPNFLAGWDACILPFRKGESTRFASPSKVLEYMAADRAIASTSIPDVAELYGDIVHLGDGPQGFLEACERALASSEGDRAARRARAEHVLERTSWDETVGRMNSIVGPLAGDGRIRESRALESASYRAFA